MEDRDRLFLAYSRKLLRQLREVKRYLETGDAQSAMNLLNGLITDTERDLQDGE